MKAPLLVSALTLVASPLLAQTSTTTSASSTTTTAPAATTTPAAQAPPGGGMMEQVMSVLTPAEKTQLMSARTKAMADNPALQTEEMSLMQQGAALQSGTGTDADKDAFRTAIQSHGQKVRDAMVKADPTVEPLLKKVEAQADKLRAQYQAAH